MCLLKRVYADFNNADAQGRLRLNCRGTIEDLAQQQITLQDGLRLRFYMEDVETVGRVSFSREERLWVADIDWDELDEVERRQ